MQKINRIAKDELLQNMKVLSSIYDVVRLVEPESTAVIKFGDNGDTVEDKDSCFSVWEKNQRCKNCISLRACTENRRITKFEFRNNETFSVVAVPYIVIDGDEVLKLSMELVNKVEDSLILEADGVDAQSQKVMEINNRLYQDSLTGAYNRRYYDENRYIFEMAHTLPKKIGYLVIDVNRFKHINDQYGHTHGDEVLAKIAEVLKLNVRLNDRVIRTGGDEFLIAMKDCNPRFMEKKMYQIKRAVARIKFAWMKDICPSVAIGMSFTDHFDGRRESLKKLYEQADAEMYEDKKAPTEYSKQKSVLVVDDTEINRAMVRKQIGNQFKIYEAKNGLEALDILKKYQVDLIITDIFMDEMNGYEFMSQVKSNPSFRDIHIIAVTENNESSQKQAIEAGADIYIDRPLGEYLSDTVAKLTGRDHGRKELFDMDFLLDTIPGAVIVYKIPREGEMEIVSCSRGVNQLSGWESDEFCNADTVRNVAPIYPADLEKFNSTMDRMVKTHSRGEVIYRGYKKDGTIVWIWFQGRYIGEEDGCDIVEAILLDVSNNTNMYQSILDSSTSAITVVDAHSFEVLYANRKADELVNKNHGEYIGSTCYEFVFHRSEPCKRCICNYKRKEWNEVEFQSNGKTYKTLFRRILWHGIEAFLEYSEDISMIKENIAYAENQKDLQNQILQNVPTGIIVFEVKNNNFSVIEANDILCEMMNIDKIKLMQCRNQELYSLVHNDDIESSLAAIRKLKVPNADVTYEFRSFNREQKEYIWMHAHGRSTLQPNGSVYIYLNFRDITERRLLEKAQRDLLESEKMAEAKAEFYSRMSHDMRTPMNGILGITELAREDQDMETIKADLDKIEQSGNYMLNLINDTLDYQRLESGKTKLNYDVVYASDLLENADIMLQTTAKAKNVELTVNSDGIDTDCFIRIDEMRFKQIFINLISNAIKFTPSGGKVDFTIENLGINGMVCHEKMIISDTGIGMSKNFLENDIFKPFSQEKNDVTMNNAGSGLGLSIVKSLIELMNGKIEVESEVGTGTQFTIYLDVERVSSEAAKEHNKKDADRLKPGVDLTGKKILLCEDHPLNAEIVKRLLQRVHVDVEWVKDGEEGVLAFQNSTQGYYSAVLMDIRMPKMDGLEATRQIRALDKEDAKTVPIIAMSANAYEEDVKKSLDAGMDAHLAKPVEAYAVYETLGKYIK